MGSDYPYSIGVRCCAVNSSAGKKRYNITLLPGDGIGPEVISIAKNVLQQAGSLEGVEFSFREMPVGGASLDLVGLPLPEDTISAAKDSDAVLLGAIGGYKWDKNEKHLKPETGLLQLRAALKVFANLRPATVLPQWTLKREVAEGVDLMVVRELTGGIYFGVPRGIKTNENGEEVGFNTEVYAAHEIDRIARVAFETARKRRGKLCSVDKANVLDASILWRRRVTALAAEYPDVELSHMYVDNAAMQLVRDPKQFDTIVTNNIFGDILSDEASMITGSIGMLPSASLSDSGPGLFEPIHGSAPDIAGQDKANPLATILSAAMLLKYGLGEEKAAKRIEDAVLGALNKGFRTGDIYSNGTKLVGCKEMGEECLYAKRVSISFISHNVSDRVEFSFREMPVGGAALDLVGVPLPEETISAAKNSDAVLLGAIGGYKWDKNEKHLKPETGLLQLRAALKVFANLRPATVLPQVTLFLLSGVLVSGCFDFLKREVAEGVDLMVVRELTGGIYFGEPRGIKTNENGEEVGFNTEVYAAHEIDRIARVAFETARKRRGKLCSVDKANVLDASILWRRRVAALAAEYPDVELSHMYVDNAAMQLVRDHKQFDTIVTNNIFGDILSDEASMITGSIGMLPSASLSDSGPGLFEPIHGSAPDIAGQDKANPLATILSAAMLLKYGLGEEKAAKRIEDAVLGALNKGFRTGDIYSNGTVLFLNHSYYNVSCSIIV
ncbi:hypothetical protein F2Q70_00045763 [Brassica cretica]|uniref:3-isopropylmalate dehydrogenase n=1 Tax=Brassica cretica TaxID=69181 RepID=A0A8S9KDR9_BRACR|nr:hypothetical protein F2Q70_00045763 [Brassica cretica]